MMCYKDMTFCLYYTECARETTCTRALTPDIISKANKIKLYIAQYADKPPCFKNKKQDSK